jgi:hypothetical protein
MCPETGSEQAGIEFTYYIKNCVPATSVHALPCACRRLEFLRPTLQRPARSTMSLRARTLFLGGRIQFTAIISLADCAQTQKVTETNVDSWH